jgi:ribosomal protein L21
MDVDKPTSSVAKRPSSGKILKKKRPNKIVFPKYKERKGKKN